MDSLLVQTLALTVTPACVIVVLGFVSRSAVNQFLARNIEAHKAALAASTDREVERLKADLRRIVYEHEVTFSRLHQERAEAIKLLYQKALAVASAARRFARGDDVNCLDDFEASRKAVDTTLNDFYNVMFESRIFLSESLCVKLDRLLHEIIAPATEIAGGYLLPFRPPDERLHARLSDKKRVEEATWQLESEIAEEFRKLLGVGKTEIA